MRVRSLVSLAALLALCMGTAAAPVPRDAPELTVTDLLGQKQDLSQFKGDVVVVEFMLTRCRGCLRMAQTINKLNGEMAERGLQPIGVVFDFGVDTAMIRDLANVLKLTYPVGYTTPDDVDRYLARDGAERIQVPQLVVIDRAGRIRAQSLPMGDKSLIDESYLRKLLSALLDEQAPQPSK